MAPVEFVFWGTMTALILLDLSLIGTLIVPSLRIWPPPGQDTWQYRLTWALFGGACAGFLVLGGLDAGSLGLHRWLGKAGTLIVGSTLFMCGTTIASYAMGYLGLRGCLGLEAELVTEGPFAVSRNPGYVGDLILMAGYVILTDSRLAGLVAAGAALWFLLAPLAEELWLEKQYGKDYRRYKKQHPRFLGWSSFGTPARERA
jgi:protein-S-isoprenylcysteine O-methyltransferase Ste14